MNARHKFLLSRHARESRRWAKLLAKYGGDRQAARLDWLLAEGLGRCAPRRKAGVVAKGRG